MMYPVKKEEVIRPAMYFCDLTAKQVSELFCKGPLFRFELCSVSVRYHIYSKKPMLFGCIRAAESSSRDGSPPQDGFLEVFRREDNDPLVVPRSCDALLRDCFFSVPVSNPVHIHVKLYVKFGKWEAYEIDDDYHSQGVTTHNDDDLHDVDVEAILAKATTGLEFAKQDLLWHILSLSDDEAGCKMNETLVPRMKKEEVGDGPFEICNEYINISDYLSKRRYGLGSYKTNSKYGSLKLCYMALKNTVDASAEVEFVATSCEEKKVVGRIMAYYGKGFNYYGREEEHLYSLMLFDRRVENPIVIKPGKLNLARSVLPVPAKFSLILSVYFHDFNSKRVMLDDTYEFLVPCDGSNSVGTIVGNDCSLNLKVNWKLPFDHMPSI